MGDLSSDIHLVGDMLGHVLRAHGSEELFEHVEVMRGLAKEARASSGPEREAAQQRLIERARSFPAEVAADVSRAFTLYFQLVNLAEDQDRLRRFRAAEHASALSEVEETFAHALKSTDATREEALEVLNEVFVQFVFTAHPTESRRRTTERLLIDVRETLSVRERQALSPREQGREDRRLRAAVESLFEHRPERREKPDVIDEVRTGLWYLEHVLLDVVPSTRRRLWRAFEERFGEIDPLSISSPVGFGSWMGGDRDGNPFVTDAVTERTMELQRRVVLDRYKRDLTELIDPLAAASERLSDSPALLRAIARAEQALPEGAIGLVRPARGEPLRDFLSLMMERVDRARAFSAGAYFDASEFLADLGALRSALLSAGATALPNDRLLSLIFRVQTFGFFLARLDVREDSTVHRQLVAELLDDPEYPTRSTSERVRLLKELRLPVDAAGLTEGSERALALFRTLHRLQGRFGSDAVGSYIISMTESEADVLEVFELCRLHGIVHNLNVAPLFETPKDLENAAEITRTLLSDDSFREQVRQRGDVLEVLVGYSDSMKRGGIVKSRVGIADGQRAIAKVAHAHEVRLRIFHGRGGSVSRGGGPTHRAIEALPPEAFSGDMKITEQGEMRAFNFANPELAIRYLEQTASAAIVARHRARQADVSTRSADGDLAKELSSASYSAYQSLVGDSHLLAYFQQCTPSEVIQELHLGSRPSKRRDQKGVGDLRAIPWVFAWAQSRHMLTGWYGVGTALQQALETHGVEVTRKKISQSAGLTDLLENVEAALVKTDLGIASAYAGLAENAEETARFFGLVQAEFERTTRALMVLDEGGQLLSHNRSLAESVRLRNPYIDPLSYLQVEALRHLRDPELSVEEQKGYHRLAQLTAQGIAAGLRYTG